MKPAQTLRAFDRFLSERSLELDAVVVGGSALALLGLITRETRDCDILHPEIPIEVKSAAVDFAAEARERGEPLADGWLNNGPSSLAPLLPPDWQDRLEVVFSGAAMRLRSLGRPELLMSKVFALCDRGIDIADCVALRPTDTELAQLQPWLERQDANPEWPAHVVAVLADLARKVRGGI